MNYLYANIFIVIFLFIAAYVINNTGNCDKDKNFCINIRNGRISDPSTNANANTNANTNANANANTNANAVNGFQDTTSSIVTFNCESKLNDSNVNIVFLVLAVIAFIVNLFIIYNGFIPTPNYVLGVLIYLALFIMIIFISIDCISQIECNNCKPVSQGNKELHNIILSILFFLYFFVIISIVYYDDSAEYYN